MSLFMTPEPESIPNCPLLACRKQYQIQCIYCAESQATQQFFSDRTPTEPEPNPNIFLKTQFQRPDIRVAPLCSRRGRDGSGHGAAEILQEVVKLDGSLGSCAPGIGLLISPSGQPRTGQPGNSRQFHNPGGVKAANQVKGVISVFTTFTGLDSPQRQKMSVGLRDRPA